MSGRLDDVENEGRGEAGATRRVRGERDTVAGWVMKNVLSADGWDDEIRALV